jgi:cyclic pyranopterin phosphate synthase
VPINTDSYGRKLDYLRVSVTDRCNLRCVYCMPAQGVPLRSHQDILRVEQIARVVEAGAALGIGKVRLTGGEPLVRKGIVDLVQQVAALPGITDVAMTTNAHFLPRFAASLAAAGLARVNISLDSLRPERFARISRLGDLGAVMRGIAAAEEAGLRPLKINMVVVRGLNDDELVDFASLTYEHDWHVRFIECMPLGGADDWGPGMPAPGARLVSAAEMRRRLAVLGPLAPVAGPAGHGPATYFRLPGAQGTLGFITAVSKHFCAACNRLRLTADGRLRTCLYTDAGVHLKPALDAGAGPAELQALIAQAVGLKGARRPLHPASHVAGEAMSAIGG